jgi:hypothetical protein
MARIDAAIAERAEQQLGLITHEQLQMIGCSDSMRRSRVRQGTLVPAGRRVVRAAAVPRSWEQRVLALLLDAGPGSAISHRSAAALWGFRGITPGAVEVSVPSDRRPRPLEGVIHRVGTLPPADVCTKGLFTLTSPARTFLDIADRLPARMLEAILDHGARDGTLSADHVEARLADLRGSGRRGVAKIERLLGDGTKGPRPESWLERELLHILDAAGAPRPELQAELRLPSGRLVRVDGLYRRHGLVVELDGHGSHATRRERQHDAERAAELLALGLRVLVFTYEDVTERPAYVVSTLLAQLERASLDGSEAWRSHSVQ